MRYLLDTDILGKLLKRTRSIALIARLAAVPPEEQSTSSITLGELVYGAYRRVGHTAILLQQIEEKLLPNLAVLPFEAAAARRYGELRASLEQEGTPVGDADLRIASIAPARDITVVTGNVRHFLRVPNLPIEHWLE